jgi:methylmalonyl-CoA/ethylmalonyl-CoA epimerase
MRMKLHHYGLATQNLTRTAELFRSLGYHVNEPVFDPIQRVEACFASLTSECPIELICDSGAGGPTSGFISKVGSGLYHICYEVGDMEETIELLRRKHFLLKQKPVEATAFGGKRIAWLYNRDIGLIELLER